MSTPRSYRTTRDIVIPAGTAIEAPPTRSSRWGTDHEGVVGLGPDHAGYFSMNIAEGVASGAVEVAD